MRGAGKTTAVRRIFAEVGEVCETVVPVRGAGVAEEERGYGG
ncbi:hypothetical protein [Methanofollis fontis]|nr:hypothetical protein [Methanofollis fontis]